MVATTNVSWGSLSEGGLAGLIQEARPGEVVLVPPSLGRSLGRQARETLYTSMRVGLGVSDWRAYGGSYVGKCTTEEKKIAGTFGEFLEEKYGSVE